MEVSELQRLYETYGYYVHRRCLKLLGRPSEAEDALHDVFIKLMESPPTDTDERGLLPWLNRVVTNHCLNLLRRSSVRTRYAPVLAALPDDDGGALQTLVERADLVGWLLGETDRESREIVIRYFFDEEPVDRIGEALGISVPTVRRRLKAFVTGARERADREREHALAGA